MTPDRKIEEEIDYFPLGIADIKTGHYLHGVRQRIADDLRIQSEEIKQCGQGSDLEVEEKVEKLRYPTPI